MTQKNVKKKVKKLKKLIKRKIKDKNIGIYLYYCKIHNLIFGDVMDYVVLDDKKLVLFFIPKNANSSLRNAFYKVLYKKDIKKATEWASRSRTPPDRRGYLKIAFVRNPYDRLVSGYFQKIKSAEKKNSVMLNSYSYFHERMSFKEFVRVISKVNDKRIDRHFRSQYTFITDSNGKFFSKLLIGKFENLEEDFKKACKKLGEEPVKLPRLNKSKRDRDFMKYYDEETRRLAYRRYKKDFELFGYEKNPLNNKK